MNNFVNRSCLKRATKLSKVTGFYPTICLVIGPNNLHIFLKTNFSAVKQKNDMRRCGGLGLKNIFLPAEAVPDRLPCKQAYVPEGELGVVSLTTVVEHCEFQEINYFPPFSCDTLFCA